eukprot:UN33957
MSKQKQLTHQRSKSDYVRPLSSHESSLESAFDASSPIESIVRSRKKDPSSGSSGVPSISYHERSLSVSELKNLSALADKNRIYDTIDEDTPTSDYKESSPTPTSGFTGTSSTPFDKKNQQSSDAGSPRGIGDIGSANSITFESDEDEDEPTFNSTLP